METKEKILEILDRHNKFPEEIQKKIGRDRAVVYSVYLLEKNEIEPTFQRICITAFKLFPESFSFIEFPDYPDSRNVRNCLWHCVYKSKGWLRGSDKTHYNVTEKGNEIVEIFLDLIENDMNVKSLPFSLQRKGTTKKELTTRALDTELNLLHEIKSSRAYSLFPDDISQIISIDIKKSLGGDRYSPESYLQNRLFKALKSSKIAMDKDAEAYLRWVEDNWSKFFGGG